MKTLLVFLFLAVSNFYFTQNLQIVKLSGVKINGKLKIFASKKDYLALMGKLDRREREFPGCSNYDEEAQKGTSFHNYYKDGINYLVYGNHADFERIELNKNPKSFLMIENYKITGNTSLQEIKAMFPNAYKAYKRSGDRFIRLKFNAAWDDELQIEIKSGKVGTIYYWTPC